MRCRSAMTLVELSVFATIGLVLMMLVIGLITTAERQDCATGERLDGVSALALSIERVRTDALTARELAVSGDGAELTAKNDVREQVYTNAAGVLRRGSDPVARCAAQFAEVDGVLGVDLTSGSGRPQHIGMKMREPAQKVALFLQEKHLRDQFPEWNARQEEH